MKLVFVCALLFLTGCTHFQRSIPSGVGIDQGHSIQDSIDRGTQRENQKRTR